MMRFIALTGAMLAVTLATESDAFGCSCGSSGPPCQGAWNVSAVFAGTVLSLSEIDNDSLGAPYQSKLVKVSVERPFVGDAAGTVDVVTGMGGGDCGYDFKKGQQYLIYAYRSPTSGRLTASICSRTRLLKDAAEDVRYLTTVGPTGTGGRVFGRINELRRDPAESEAVDYGPVEGLSISVRGATFGRDVTTDAEGRFEIGQVPVGKSTFTATMPFGFEPRVWETEFEIRDPRACMEISFPIMPSAHASGIVVDASGRPVPGVMVDAVAAELAGFDPPQHQFPASTNEHGEFHFDRLPPGSYVFGINLTNPGYGPRRGTPIFLPGTPLARDAAVVELKAGEDKEVGTLRLVK